MRLLFCVLLSTKKFKFVTFTIVGLAGMLLFTAPNVDNECLQILSNSYDPRDGFDLILFGLDVHEKHSIRMYYFEV
jgi:hypothetical protein